MKIRPNLVFMLVALNTLAVMGYVSYRKSIRPVYAQAAEGTAGEFKMRLPEFTLVDSAGKTVTDKDFQGRPWVFDFIYTDCPAQCPMMTTKMGALQKALPEGVGFASFSVNPEKDSPAVLAEYAKRFGADSSRWRFLTGRRDETEKILAALGAPSGPAFDAHSVRFYLIDKSGRLAGLYDTGDDNALKNLTADAEELVKVS